MEVEATTQAADAITETTIDVRTVVIEEVMTEEMIGVEINRFSKVDPGFQMLQLLYPKCMWPILRAEIKINTHKNRTHSRGLSNQISHLV